MEQWKTQWQKREKIIARQLKRFPLFVGEFGKVIKQMGGLFFLRMDFLQCHPNSHQLKLDNDNGSAVIKNGVHSKNQIADRNNDSTPIVASDY